jgi:predicted MFS family arabinose efflux permease
MLRRLLVLVSAVVLVDVVFYSAIVPLLPSYTDDLDLSKSEAGVLAGSYAAGTLVASIPAGWLAARFGPKAILLLGLGLLVASCVVFGFAERYEVLVGARFVQGVGGAGSWAAGMAWLLAVAPRERRGELIGTALGVAIAGALGGPVVGAVAQEVGTEIVFNAIALVAALLVLAVVATPRPEQPEPTSGLAGALRNRHVLVGAWLTTLPALFFGSFSVLTSLRLDDLGVSAAGVAAVFLAAAAFEAVMSPIVGRLSDRRGRALPLRLGLTGVIAMCIALPLAEATSALLAVTAVVAAALAGMMWAPAMALLSDGAQAAGVSQALAFGLVNLAWAGGQVAGSAGGSATADATSDAVTYGILAALATLSLGMLVRARVASTA